LLYYNSLSSVPPDLFDGLSNLQEVHLSDNGLSCRPAILSNTSFLTIFSQPDTVTENLPVCEGKIDPEPPIMSRYGVVDPITITLSNDFSLYDDDFSPYPSPEGSLIYTPVSSHSEVVTASVNEGLLMITPISRGTATVTVSLSGAGQLSERPSTIGNDPIVYRKSIDLIYSISAYPLGTIISPEPLLDRTIKSQLTIDLPKHFTDFFDDQFIPLDEYLKDPAASLTYTASSSNESAVTVPMPITDNSLAIMPISPGISTITVTLAGAGQLIGKNPISETREINRNFKIFVSTVNLVLSPSTINENESPNKTTVTATLEAPLEEETILMVSVEPVAPATAKDFTLSNNILTIAAGETNSTGRVTITADNNNVDEPNKIFTVQATASGGHGIAPPEPKELIITDDDELPIATLTLSPNMINENGGISTVTAMLEHPSSEEIILTVSVEPVVPTMTKQFTLSNNKTLTIAAGETTSSGTVTITPLNDQSHSGDETITVLATA